MYTNHLTIHNEDAANAAIALSTVLGLVANFSFHIPGGVAGPLTTLATALVLKLFDSWLRRVESKKAARDSAEAVVAASPSQVLVVDDEDVMHTLATKLEGVATIHAWSRADTFMKLAKHKHIKIILLDLKLPDVRDIQTFAKEVRDVAGAEMKIIVTSGVEKAPFIAKNIKAICMIKPIQLDQLAKAISDALSS